jgi:hypothetical protein
VVSPLSGQAGSMQSHKFAVGQKVAFRPDLGQLANRGEVFVIERRLPETEGVFQYEIKSEMDGHARIVMETQLTDL